MQCLGAHAPLVTEGATLPKAKERPQSGYRGVQWDGDEQKFVALIGIHGETKNLGYFDTAIAAALAYDEIAVDNPLPGGGPRDTNKSLGWLDRDPWDNAVSADIEINSTEKEQTKPEKSELAPTVEISPEVRNYVRVQEQKTTAEYFKTVPNAPHLPGFTYIIYLPDSDRFKIGYTSKPDALGLAKRFKDAKKYFGNMLPVATLEGGRTLEACLHVKFDHLRIKTELNEQFQASSELWAFALYHGHCKIGQWAVYQYMDMHQEDIQQV